MDDIITFEDSKIYIQWLDGKSDSYIVSTITIYNDKIIMTTDDAGNFIIVQISQIRFYEIHKQNIY